MIFFICSIKLPRCLSCDKTYWQQLMAFFIKDYMVFSFKGVGVYYRVINEGASRPLVVLHGWGRSGEDFDEFVSFYENRTIVLIDFPPFGKSGSNLKDWNIYTYVSMLISLCEHLKIDNADFLGHSFGGRIAIILSCVKCSLVHSCILVGSAGLKPKRSIKYRLNLAFFKLGKRLHMPVKGKASRDYKALSPEMKKTFKSIVNTHLNSYAKHMKVCTLIVWGREDKETPIYMAKRLNRYIKNSRLEIIENGGHFCFLDCPLEFFSIVYQFLKEEK